MELQLLEYEHKIREELREEFKETYNQVFNSDGSISKCGRELCKKLILQAKHIGERNRHYGNVKDGFMNCEALKELYNSI